MVAAVEKSRLLPMLFPSLVPSDGLLKNDASSVCLCLCIIDPWPDGILLVGFWRGIVDATE